jgi:putative toxin-antitoxin system antitoxin component (TIGR02293 family)
MTTITAILGGEKQLGVKIREELDFDKLIRKGMPYAVIEYLKDKLKLADEEIAKIIGTSIRTLSRRRQHPGKKGTEEQRLSPVESDRLYRLAKIYALAERVLEDSEQAVEWLHSGQFGLGGRIPLEMIQTEIGAQEVEDLLVRIEHGVYS